MVPWADERDIQLFDHGSEYDSQWAVITSIAEKLGMAAETVRVWVRRAEADQ